MPNVFKEFARTAGFDVFRNRTREWLWSHTVDDYYPVDATPRWGFGKPEHERIQKVLEKEKTVYSKLIASFDRHNALFASIPRDGESQSLTPFWKNDWFENADALLLMGLLAENKPSRLFEIGSGVSTKFARHTINQTGSNTHITSLDPEPRFGIDRLCDRVIRSGLETCALTEFDVLKAGDILFFDGSHRSFQNSDVTVFFIDIMPRLASGVIVHIHDIFLPSDYPQRWSKRMYSEQYLLAAMLLCENPGFRVVSPNFHICNSSAIQPQVKRLTDSLGLLCEGQSFWLQKT